MVVQTVLFVTGINTMLQTLFGSRLPTVIGGSYAFIIPIISIIRDPSLLQIADDHTVSVQCFLSFQLFRIVSIPKLRCFLVLLQRFTMTMRAIQGALIISSSIQIIVGYSQLWAICSRYRQCPPV
jgi:xanthine/uracil permease